MARESKIEKEVSAYAIKRGCYVRKFKSANQRGVPDKLFLTRFGKVFFIEFKAPGKQPNALQLREIREIENRKGQVQVVDSILIGKQVIDFYTE